MLLWTPAQSHSGCTSSSHATLRLEIYAPPKQPGTPNPELGTAPHRYDLLKMSKLQGQIRALSKFV